jgi:hypothetical protein
MKHRKAALSCAGVSIAVVLLSALVASPAQSASTVVPWLNQPAAAQSANAPAAPAAIHPCAASDLQVVVGQQGAYHGQATQEIRFTNLSSEACSFTGFPETQILPSNAAPRAVAAHAQAPQLANEHIDLAPGQDAVMLVGTPGSCEAANGPERKVATRMKLAFPGGGAKTVEGTYVDTLCGDATVLRFEPVHNEAVAKARAAAAGTASPLDQLTGSVTVAETANRGEVLHYSVTITNPTSSPISLATCPAYTQSLYDDGKTVSNTLRLNCGATSAQIDANSSVTFEMQLAIPASLPAGGAKLSWNMQNGPAVGALIALQ